MDTSRLQKRQNAPKHQDYKDLVRVVQEVKDTAETFIKIRPIKNMVVAAFTDSSLYGSEGELIPDDEALKGFEKHKLHSQAGSLLVIMNKDTLDDVGDVPFSFADWRTRASRRVIHSTFAAEAQAAVETFGLAKYCRAYLCDILFGYADWKGLDDYGENEIPIMLFTDCKSLFDNLKKEGSVPDDKWVAVPVASLRGAVSAGPGRDTRKAEARWVPSRWQLADCLTKMALSAGFRETMNKSTTRLHELSLQHVKRNKTAKLAKAVDRNHAPLTGTHYTWLCYDTDTTTTTQLPQQVANPSSGCNPFESHVSGGPSVFEDFAENFRHCSKRTRSAAQSTWKTLKIAVWKTLTKTFTMPSSSSVQKIKETHGAAEDRIELEMLTAESAVQDSPLLEAPVVVKIEQDDDEIEKGQLERVLGIHGDLAFLQNPEKEQELADFESYEPKKDHEHLYWVPHKLMCYALRTQPFLRFLFRESYVEFKNDDDYIVNCSTREKQITSARCGRSFGLERSCMIQKNLVELISQDFTAHFFRMLTSL